MLPPAPAAIRQPSIARRRSLRRDLRPQGIGDRLVEWPLRRRGSVVEQPIRNRQVVSSNLTVGSRNQKGRAESARPFLLRSLGPFFPKRTGGKGLELLLP
jgi:hypothetical protein